MNVSFFGGRCENALNRVKKSTAALHRIAAGKKEEMNVSLLPKKSCFHCGDLCLDLHQVCDGVIDCIQTQEDEKFCKIRKYKVLQIWEMF